MDTDENFSFNFHVGEVRKEKKKIVVTGKTVRERSKQRKHLKSLRDAEKTVTQEHEKKPDVEEPPSTDNFPKKNAAKPISGKKSGHVISSLFTKNPVVPKMECADVSPVIEEIFSNQPFSSISDLHPHMVTNLESRLGLSTMTSIQTRSIPHIMACDRDVLVQSQTGSGKTLAYAVPIVNRLQAETPKLTRSDGTFAVILVPTRELAVQTYECFVKLVYPFTWIVPGCLMGGEKRKAEKARIRKGMNILVATPGRLQDHLDKTETLNLARLKWIVIDEADRLLDMGYEKSIQEVLSKVKEKSRFEHHTVLLSATLSKGVERLAGLSLTNPLRLSVNESKSESETETESESFAIPENLIQKYIIVPLKLRLVTLSAFIMDKFMISQKPAKIIVFLSTHVSVDFHYDVFSSVVCRKSDDDKDISDVDFSWRLESVRAYKLHGEMKQSERVETFQDFVKAKSGVLFCTDVAARGLHLPKVHWIIQYTAPPSCSEYIHRIGRTARAGSKGQSLLFLLPSETEYISLLNDQNIRLEQIEMNSVLERLILTKNIQKSGKKGSGGIDENVTRLQTAFEQDVLNDVTRTELAGKACLSYIRGYSTYPKPVKHIFVVRGLHLGHVAKSFALRQAPKQLGSKYGGQMETQDRKRKPQKRRLDASKVSEFGDGNIVSKKKKKKASENP